MSQPSHALPTPAPTPPTPPRTLVPRIPLALAILGLLLSMMIYGPVRGIRLRLFPR